MSAPSLGSVINVAQPHSSAYDYAIVLSNLGEDDYPGGTYYEVAAAVFEPLDGAAGDAESGYRITVRTVAVYASSDDAHSYRRAAGVHRSAFVGT